MHNNYYPNKSLTARILQNEPLKCFILVPVLRERQKFHESCDILAGERKQFKGGDEKLETGRRAGILSPVIFM